MNDTLVDQLGPSKHFHTSVPASASIDIFCRVIDNYGDIGVCWRLACNLLSQLNDQNFLSPFTFGLKDGKAPEDSFFDISELFPKETTFKKNIKEAKFKAQEINLIRLWVDDLHSFERIVPRIKTDKAVQTVAISRGKIAGFITTHSHIGEANTPTTPLENEILSKPYHAAECLDNLNSSKTQVPFAYLKNTNSTKNPSSFKNQENDDFSKSPPFPESLENRDITKKQIASECLHEPSEEYPALESHEDNRNTDITGFIQIHHWHEPLKGITPAPISIEAFACELDPAYIAAMPGHTQAWFNLDYLSAESWTESFHGQPSIQHNGVTKYFFFPGFNERTGGLLREVDLQQRQAHFLQNKAAQLNWLRDYMSPAVAEQWQKGARLISLFCYPQAPIKTLFDALLKSPQHTILCIPQGVAKEAESLLSSLFAPSIRDDRPNRAQIYIHRFEFLDQYQFDYLLWLADMNFVRGEDSFIRAIWAGKPFVWHIYPQTEQTHIEKLQAWLESYPMPEIWRQVFLQWNCGEAPSLSHEINMATANIDDRIVTRVTGTSDKRGTTTDATDNLLPLSSPALHSEPIPPTALEIALCEKEKEAVLRQFALEYRDFLQKKPTLSFRLLSFYPNPKQNG